MKENDKNIENLIEKMMADQKLQSPSIDFTSKTMFQIQAAEKSKIKAYKPLISKRTWVFVSGLLFALIIYSIMTASNNDLNMTKLYSQKISAIFSGIHVSKNILYAFLVVPFMVLIQIPILKNYFDRKYEL